MPAAWVSRNFGQLGVEILRAFLCDKASSLLYNKLMKQRYDLVYVYTTDVKKPLNRVKIGKATRVAGSPEDAALIRIKEQFTAGNRDEKVELLHIFDQTESDRSATQVESALHKILSARNVGGEWFDLTNIDEKYDFNLVLSAYNKYMDGVDRPYSFPLRHNQQSFVDKAYSYFAGGGESFLLAAIMRFGKTFSTYKLIEKLGFKEVLILSAKTEVKLAWEEDLILHVDFRDCDWYDADEASKDNPIEIKNDGKVHITFLTLQDIKDYGKKKLQNIVSHKWDLVILDETHFATETERTYDLLSKLIYKHRLDMSGTAFQKLLSGEYTSENSFVYSLIEETRDVNSKLFDQSEYPHLNLYTVHIAEEIKKEADDYYEDEEGFKFSTLFATNEEGKFVHPNAVRKVLDIMSSENPRAFGGISPFSLDVLSDKLDHTIWYLPPRVDSSKALAEMMRQHNYWNQYDIYIAAGDNEKLSNDDIVTKVKYLSEERSGKKTIVLSDGKLSHGVSVKKWTVFLMNDSTSPESYFQSMFRCKTPNKPVKTECDAIDFNPDRALRMWYKYAEATAIYEDKETLDILKEFYDVLPIMNCKSNTLSAISIEDILSAMGRNFESLNTWARGGLVTHAEIPEEIAEELMSIDAADIEKFESQVSANEIRKGKVQKNKKKKTAKDEEDSFSRLRERALAVIQTLPKFMQCTDVNEFSVKSLLSSAQKNDDLFEEISGINHEIFDRMIELGIVNRKLLTIALEEYHLVTR